MTFLYDGVCVLVVATVVVGDDHFIKVDVVTHEFVHVAVVYFDTHDTVVVFVVDFDTHDTVVVFVVDFTVTLFQKATNE